MSTRRFDPARLHHIIKLPGCKKSAKLLQIVLKTGSGHRLIALLIGADLDLTGNDWVHRESNLFYILTGNVFPLYTEQRFAA